MQVDNMYNFFGWYHYVDKSLVADCLGSFTISIFKVMWLHSVHSHCIQYRLLELLCLIHQMIVKGTWDRKIDFSGTRLFNPNAGDGRISGMSEKLPSSVLCHHTRTGFIFSFNCCENLKHSKLIFINSCLFSRIIRCFVWLSCLDSSCLYSFWFSVSSLYRFLKFWRWLHTNDQ
jgi:hypothetical protein